MTWSFQGKSKNYEFKYQTTIWVGEVVFVTFCSNHFGQFRMQKWLIYVALLA